MNASVSHCHSDAMQKACILSGLQQALKFITELSTSGCGSAGLSSTCLHIHLRLKTTSSLLFSGKITRVQGAKTNTFMTFTVGMATYIPLAKASQTSKLHVNGMCVCVYVCILFLFSYTADHMNK